MVCLLYTSLLPCLHRRAGQDDAGYLLGLEGFHRHSNGQIGLAGTRRANAKGDGIGADGIETVSYTHLQHRAVPAAATTTTA